MNKQVTFLFFFIISFLNCFSQTTAVDKALSYIKTNELLQAKQTIIEAEKEGKNSMDPKFWFYKGLIFHSIYDSNNSEIKDQTPNALKISYQSYTKALELDANKQYHTKIMKSLGILTNQFVKKGVDSFNNKNYNDALYYFQSSIEINLMPEIMFYDTILYYNAAISAEKLNQFDKAENFYKTLISLKYGEGEIYLSLAKLYKKKKEIEKYEQILLDGVKQYPNDNNIYIELINHYLETSDIDNAFKFVNKSLELDTTNAGLYFVSGSLYETKNDSKNAENAYKKSLKIDSTYIDSAYNLGALYYNKANDLFSHAKTKKEKETYENYFKQSLKYFKIVEENDGIDKNVLLTLRNIYRILDMSDKKLEIDRKLEKYR